MVFYVLKDLDKTPGLSILSPFDIPKNTDHLDQKNIKNLFFTQRFETVFSKNIFQIQRFWY